MGRSDPNGVTFLVNPGDGSFGASVNVDLQLFPRGLAVGDLDGDGDPELATAMDAEDSVVATSQKGGPPDTSPMNQVITLRAGGERQHEVV